MIRRWAVTATRTYTHSDGWVSSRELPIFYLDADVQGIITRQGALQVARDILIDDPNTIHTIHVEEAAL